MTSLGNKVVKPTSPRLQDALTRCRVGGSVQGRGVSAGLGGQCRVREVRCRVGGSVQGQEVRCRVRRSGAWLGASI